MLTISRYKVRPMTEADIAQVVAIERESFPTTSWPQTAYRRELTNRLARYRIVIDSSRAVEAPSQPVTRRSFLGLFKASEPPAETTDYIAGYVGLWLMVDEAHIVAIAVREEYRRRGLGELLLADAIDLALESNLEVVTLEVRRSNAPAQSLYEKYRFLKVGVRRRYYSDNGEDALIMSTPPIHTGSYQEHLQQLRKEWERRWLEGQSTGPLTDDV
jgi:ribosomal-protein-alanine N-acetyltransferase